MFGNDVGADVVAGHIAGGFEHIEDRVDPERQGNDRCGLRGVEPGVFKDHEEEKNASSRNSSRADRGEDNRNQQDQYLCCRERDPEDV